MKGKREWHQCGRASWRKVGSASNAPGRRFASRGHDRPPTKAGRRRGGPLGYPTRPAEGAWTSQAASGFSPDGASAFFRHWPGFYETAGQAGSGGGDQGCRPGSYGRIRQWARLNTQFARLRRGSSLGAIAEACLLRHGRVGSTGVLENQALILIEGLAPGHGCLARQGAISAASPIGGTGPSSKPDLELGPASTFTQRVASSGAVFVWVPRGQQGNDCPSPGRREPTAVSTGRGASSLANFLPMWESVPVGAIGPGGEIYGKGGPAF